MGIWLCRFVQIILLTLRSRRWCSIGPQSASCLLFMCLYVTWDTWHRRGHRYIQCVQISKPTLHSPPFYQSFMALAWPQNLAWLDPSKGCTMLICGGLYQELVRGVPRSYIKMVWLQNNTQWGVYIIREGGGAGHKIRVDLSDLLLVRGVPRSCVKGVVWIQNQPGSAFSGGVLITYLKGPM